MSGAPVSGQRVVLKCDPFNDPDASAMEFRLTYEGTLLGASRKDTRARHKHEIRKAFHKQLRRLWEVNPYLRDGQPVTFAHGKNPFSGTAHGTTLTEWLAPRYSRCGYRFVPLVREELSLICAIDILFLRPGSPGSVLGIGGDIDNRMKTIFDALRLPANTDELGGYLTPEDGEDPFFCLLEDDRLITHAAIETDTLLEPVRDASGVNDSRLVIRVRIRPYDFNPSNMSFG